MSIPGISSGRNAALAFDLAAFAFVTRLYDGVALVRFFDLYGHFRSLLFVGKGFQSWHESDQRIW